MHVIYVDRDDDKTIRTQLALHAAHPGKRAPARCAPGCPEIDIHDLPLNAARSSRSSALAALAAGDANTGSRTITRPSACRRRISMRIAMRIEGHA